MLVDPTFVDATKQVGEVGGIDQSDGNGLAMGQRIVGLGFQRVRKRVSVVQQSTPAGFSLVGRHDVGFDLDTPGDAFRLVHGQQVVAGQEVVLGHFTATTADLPRWQRGQRIEITDDTGGLPERADQVLATYTVDSGQVHPGLAADRGVDHAEQSRRHVDD